jgi:transposase
MAWGMKDIGEQRVRFVVAVSRREKPLAQLCREFEISRPTGYVWIKRYREQGIAGLEEHSRRPRYSPRQTAEALEQRVIQMRSRWPDWGARKIGKKLEELGVKLPASTVHRIFLRHNLVREQDRIPAAVKRFEREAPNQRRWILRGPKAGMNRWGRFRCWMIILAT